MPTWPESLPQTLDQRNYNETPASQIVETEVDAGPSFRRIRSSAVPLTLTGKQLLTKAQTETLDAFFVNDLFNNVLSFEWAVPRTGEMVTMRFAKQNPYSITARSGLLYNVSYNFEILS